MRLADDSDVSMSREHILQEFSGGSFAGDDQLRAIAGAFAVLSSAWKIMIAGLIGR
jgi:hypothetical protein